MNYKVKIDNPCDQSWQEMTEVQGGKFCKHCCKTVTDFTHLGDQEVIKLIKQSSGNLCGRFTDEQLNKEFKEDKGTNNNLYSKIAASLLLLIASKSVSANTKDNPKFPLEMNADTYLKSAAKLDKSNVDDPKRKITGTLKNRDSLSISRMQVKIENTGALTTSDTDGHFEISIPDTLKGIINIYLSGIGYAEKYVQVNTDNLPTNLGEIYLDWDYRNINIVNSISGKAGGISVSNVYRRKWWQVWKKKY